MSPRVGLLLTLPHRWNSAYGKVGSPRACAINAMHITASVFINDDEPGLHQDYEEWLEQLAPHGLFPSIDTTARARTTGTRT